MTLIEALKLLDTVPNANYWPNTYGLYLGIHPIGYIYCRDVNVEVRDKENYSSTYHMEKRWFLEEYQIGYRGKETHTVKKITDTEYANMIVKTIDMQPNKERYPSDMDIHLVRYM